MKNQEKKTENQLALFKLIKKNIPAHQSLADKICDLLGTEATDAAYRRIRGETTISFDDAVMICKHFNISMDSIAGSTDKSQIQCSFAPANINDVKSYLTFTQNLANMVDRLKSDPGSNIFLSAADIPVFHFLAYKELALFQFFSWNKNTCDYQLNYEAFVEELDTHELFKNYETIVEGYQLIPSSEIWCANTVDTTLRLLSYHSEMKHFNDKKIPLFICEHLLDLMDTLHKWMTKGVKGDTNTPFMFYESEIDVGNTFILFKNKETTDCFVRLFTINGLEISDELFCKEVEHWLYSLTQRSTLIHKTSAKEGFNFVNDQKQKINAYRNSLKDKRI